MANIEGQVLLSKIIELNPKRQVIDLSGFSNGIYVITVSVDGRTYKEKIVKY